MKRYAIVRVDNMCPAITEEGINLCKTDKNCKNKCPYRYGDTKEQLIKKVMTAFTIAIKKHKEGKFIKGKSNNRQVAEIIVKFLGVEE